jgi:hypothetical protein
VKGIHVVTPKRTWKKLARDGNIFMRIELKETIGRSKENAED